MKLARYCTAAHRSAPATHRGGRSAISAFNMQKNLRHVTITDGITDFFLWDTQAFACDPRAWFQVSTLIRMQLPPTATEVAALPQGPHL